ncbi:metallopeptidase TldD-related protein [Jatrophihabitans sp.]|uniref:metallopeptidase TldD-related protein n=1 Tax=Jatrophihabitans sp. TaxID=1932789 RepID=UPI0030C7217F|nr:TldD/PmbA family protein [Jatrophihabitans sp.]
MTEIQAYIETALDASSADGCIVIATESTEANLRWAGNSLTTNGQMRTRSISVISTFDSAAGTSVGVVTRSVSSPEELQSLVHASELAGRDAGPADDAAPLVANYPNDDAWGDDPAATSVEVFEQFAPSLGDAFRRWSGAGRLLYGFAEHQVSSTFLGTSTGVRRRFDQPSGRVEINGKAGDLSSSGYVSAHTRDFADVDVAALTGELERRLGWATRRVDLPAGRYETLMPATTVADLMIYAYWTASARDAEEGRSVFAGRGGTGGTRIGEQLSTLPLRLYSDPAYPGLECSPFVVATSPMGGLQSVFDNGAPSPAVDWIADGQLANLARTRSWAERTGEQPRAIVDNLVADAGGTASIDELVANTERGLLLTCLWYIREVDPQTLLLTGLTRDGVYLVENGTVTGAVNNFRFNESPIDLLGRATEAGATIPTLSREWGDYFTRTAMPPLRIPDFNMSTVSEAS